VAHEELLLSPFQTFTVHQWHLMFNWGGVSNTNSRDRFPLIAFALQNRTNCRFWQAGVRGRLAIPFPILPSHPNMSAEPTPMTGLTDHFLIAMPQLQDSYFANSVVYICQHNHEGAVGLVINLPLRIQLWEIFEQLDMETVRSRAAPQVVLSGGPVESEKGFLLHTGGLNWPSSIRITDQLTLTTSREILADIAMNRGPEEFLITLGCAGWSEGQLEQELSDNAWFTCQATPDIIFSSDYAHKPEMAAATLGFSMSQLTSDVGYS